MSKIEQQKGRNELFLCVGLKICATIRSEGDVSKSLVIIKRLTLG